jgi:hypothetical protein
MGSTHSLEGLLGVGNPMVDPRPRVESELPNHSFPVKKTSVAPPARSSVEPGGQSSSPSLMAFRCCLWNWGFHAGRSTKVTGENTYRPMSDAFEKAIQSEIDAPVIARFRIQRSRSRGE